jgi:hypothetical protein
LGKFQLLETVRVEPTIFWLWIRHPTYHSADPDNCLFLGLKSIAYKFIILLGKVMPVVLGYFTLSLIIVRSNSFPIIILHTNLGRKSQDSKLPFALVICPRVINLLALGLRRSYCAHLLTWSKKISACSSRLIFKLPLGSRQTTHRKLVE